MKTIAISDLHGLLPEIVEPADIMFICGDISPLHIQFNKPEMWKWLTGEFMDWIIGLPVEKVYLVAGNHDAFFEGASTSKKVELSFLSSHKLIYLENELVYYVDNDGITWSIFGTPYCHQYGNWPFMRTDAYMEEKFKKIPDEVNFILTHDTPYGWKNQDVILERPRWSNKSLEHVGNEPLANRLKEIQFAWCFHGHIHSSSHEPEAIEGENTGFVVNVSYCNESYDGIYKGKSPREAKALGRMIKEYDDKAWNAERDNIMLIALSAKFDSFPQFRRFLEEHKDKTFVEASPYDNIWGIKLPENHPDALNPSKWRGENRLGKCINKLIELKL